MATIGSRRKECVSGCKGPAHDYDYNDYSQREKRSMRRQEDEETTTTGVATTKVCHCVCDYHHYSPEEEKIPAMTTIIGEKTQGEGCHYDTMTRKTAMATTMQDRLQERSSDMRRTTLSDYVIRLTDRLRDRLRLKLRAFFSHKPPQTRKTNKKAKLARKCVCVCVCFSLVFYQA